MDPFTLGTIGASLALSYFLNKDEELFSNIYNTEDTTIDATEQSRISKEHTDMIKNEWDNKISDVDNNTNDTKLKQYIQSNDIDNIKKYLTTNSDPILKRKALEFIHSSEKFLEPEHLNTMNYISQSISNDKKLSDFTNNNFVPFIRKPTQNMAGTGIQSGNYKHSDKTYKDQVNTGFSNETPHTTRLGIYTGRDLMNPKKSEAHKPTYRFKPGETKETYVNGMPVTRPEENRYEISRQRHDLKPCEQIRVGPGLNCGEDSPACDGHHNMYRPEQTYISKVLTSRSSKNKEPVGSSYYNNKGISNYAQDVGPLDILEEENFTQNGNKSNTFISKKCVPHDGRNGSIKFTTNRGNQDRPVMDRNENSRNQENGYIGPSIFENSKSQMVDDSYKNDNGIFRDNNRTELPSRTGHAHMNNGHSDKKDWYANDTTRGVENTHVLPGSMQNTGHTEHTQDQFKTTIKETTMGENVGHAYFGRGQEESGGFYNATFGNNKPLAPSNPNPAGPNILADPKTRVGNFILNKEQNTTRIPLGHQNTHFRNNSEYQIRKDTNLESNRLRDGLGGSMNTPYSYKPLDSRIDCKA